jgi:hypothetical protein
MTSDNIKDHAVSLMSWHCIRSRVRSWIGRECISYATLGHWRAPPSLRPDDLSPASIRTERTPESIRDQ